MIYQNKWSCKDAKTLQYQEYDKTNQNKASQEEAVKANEEEEEFILMARRTAQENQAISSKIQVLRDEGFSTTQATAIAFRMFRDGELTIPKESSVIYGTKRRPQNKNLLKQMAIAFELLGLANRFK
tara:strand:- start:55 stop:435 length:381 start_codon:yes stop_codon:yes gene_type:complete